METPLVRWTIGPVSSLGFECFRHSLASFLRHFEAEIVVCYNCSFEQIAWITKEHPAIRLVDQSEYLNNPIRPAGVAWKLYPPRLDINRHELSIDNDIVFNAEIPQLSAFFKGHHTLLLEDWSRTYGRFEKHVPADYRINSGLYGMPPGFNLDRYCHFYLRDQWEMNAVGEYKESKTFDEQGLIALSLLDHPNFVIIPNTVITNCERQYVEGAGHHFIGVNRKEQHRPFMLYRASQRRLFL